MGDIISALEHCRDGIIIELLVALEHGITEVWQGPQPRAIHAIDHLHDKERVFGLRIVILKIDHHILRCAVVGN